MEWYLNIVYFGEGCNGVYTAAETYFGKEPKDLTLAECASIIGITNNPSKYDPFISRENNKARQETILKQMYEQGYINKEQYDEAVAQELVFVRSESDDATQTIYSYYAEAVINDVLNDLVEQKGVSRDTARTLLYSGGYQVYSCYDPSIQQAIDDVYTDLDKMPQRPSASGQQFESAIVIMDPYTGEIKGLSGGTGKKTINFGTNRATQSKRPPGSSIKPIATYGPAMELGLITQYTQVNDAPDIKLSGTSWYPKNSGGGNYGVITIREALQRSLNTVSAQILDKLTPRASYEFLKDKLGVTSLAESDCDYAPLALGQLTNGITVREMTQAYSAFVNDGVYTPPRTFYRVEDSQGNLVCENNKESNVAMKATTAYIIRQTLKSVITSGTGGEARFSGMTIAGKTGTTDENRDRYFAGFSRITAPPSGRAISPTSGSPSPWATPPPCCGVRSCAASTTAWRTRTSTAAPAWSRSPSARTAACWPPTPAPTICGAIASPPSPWRRTPPPPKAATSTRWCATARTASTWPRNTARPAAWWRSPPWIGTARSSRTSRPRTTSTCSRPSPARRRASCARCTTRSPLSSPSSPAMTTMTTTTPASAPGRIGGTSSCRKPKIFPKIPASSTEAGILQGLSLTPFSHF